jgi:1,4-dihydroxy-2-naphthoate polyprenyltransferase
MPKISGSEKSVEIITWFKQVRPQFLILSVALVILGAAIAWNDGFFEPVKFLLTLIGLMLAHISVNVLNDYFDYKSGIDLNTEPTAFSGGSGILPRKLLQPGIVYKFGVLCLGAAFLIGVYLVLQTGWQLIPLILFGGITSYFYTSHITKLPIAELVAGLGLGSLPVIGTYVVQTTSYNWEIVAASIAPGILTANLLFLNEFPDYQADIKGGRRHLVITLGKKRSAILYAMLTGMVYVSIVAATALGMMPAASLIALLSLPFAVKAIRLTLRNYKDSLAMEPALKANVITILGTDFLLALGYLFNAFCNNKTVL